MKSLAKLLAICLLMLASSGSCGDEIPKFIDPALAPYIHDYMSECDARTECKDKKRIPLHRVEFSETLADEVAPDVVGTCEIRFFYIPGITGHFSLRGYIKVVPPSYLFTELQFRALLYHELGHCIHQLDHDPHSPIMREYLPMPDYLKKNWQYSIDELFTTQMLK